MQLALKTCNTLLFSPLTCYYYFGVGTLRHEVNLVLDSVHFREQNDVNGDWWLMRVGKVDIKGLQLLENVANGDIYLQNMG